MPAGHAGAHASQHDTIVTQARKSRLLSELVIEDLATALDHARGVEAGRGATLLPNGASGLVLVLRGAAKEQLIDVDGTVSILALLGPGENSSLGTALQAEDATEVVALEAVTALTWTADVVQQLVDERPGFAAAWFRLATEQLSRAQHWASMLGTASARERVISRLLELATCWGRIHDNAIYVDLPLTQDELASWCGVSRESAAKVLHDLRRAGVLLTGRRELIITNLAGLQARQGRTPPPSLPELLRASLG